SFEETPNNTSIVARLFRVMDVRQGVLERDGFKLIYLFNELAAMRTYIRMLQQRVPDMEPPPWPALTYALTQRQNKPISVFAVCPQKSFVQETINTQELWKSKEAAAVFSTMEHATWSILSDFKFEQPQRSIEVALINGRGEFVWDDKF